MQVNESTQGDVAVLAVSGRLDSNTAPEFEKQLMGMIKDGKTRIVLDFGPLEYISSAGLRVLLKATRELKNSDGKLVICSVKDYIQEVFDLSGFSSVFPMATDTEAAMEKFD
ncbi:STAS domain-containing protein [Desulfohalovibrio reitneri]|uniref:STAS domain-containing protein n=1 Tax=Desulfohalovibrio reitneri TaxID=1307759 RepID=UPI0004A74504|nr:STAS domain-containing protein [Desulfohalovibrio reitneri]